MTSLSRYKESYIAVANKIGQICMLIYNMEGFYRDSHIIMDIHYATTRARLNFFATRTIDA